MTRVELKKADITFKLEEKREAPGDQNVLELIERILLEQGLTLKDINSIGFNTGPGSFTGLRVGAAIANALSFGISVSINGKPIGEIELPKY